MRHLRTSSERARLGMRRDKEHGAFIVIFAIMMPLFISLLGLGIDIGHYWWVQGHLQNAADAAALAGAKEINSTAAARTRATNVARTFATQHKADGTLIAAADVTTSETGKFDFATNTFTTANVGDVDANAVRVTVRRQSVPSFFAQASAGVIEPPTLTATAIAVAGGARQVGCAWPVAIASCVLTYDSSGKLQCPTNLSFQNGSQSVGLTLPDGSSPANGNKAEPYFVAAADSPDGCAQAASAGTTVSLQNGNDLSKNSVDAINAATNNGNNPITMVLPVIDSACGGGSPSYNQSAKIVGFLKMKAVGARWTGSAPAKVAQACPTLGKKNICVTADCSMIDAPGGSTIAPSAVKSFLVQ